jgi:hypothetical protein
MQVFMIHSRLSNGKENMCNNVEYIGVSKIELLHVVFSLLHNKWLLLSFIIFVTYFFLYVTLFLVVPQTTYTFTSKKWGVTRLKVMPLKKHEQCKSPKSFQCNSHIDSKP